MNYFAQKVEVIAKMQRFLNDYSFNEVHTSVLRRDEGDLIKRIKLEENFTYALRDSHELQLRYLLTEFDSVYEIGSCFRYETEDKSKTNLSEFTLMELFTSRYNLLQIQELVRKFILSVKPDTIFDEISIADYIKENIGIDLMKEPQQLLYDYLKKRYADNLFENDYKYVLQYIEDTIEPLSHGKVVFLTDYPECTCSYANIKSGDVIERFELFANGLELANGFADECNAARFKARNKALPIFPQEEKVIAEALENAKLPSASAGVGIGIERLCMFLFNVNDINAFSLNLKIF